LVTPAAASKWRNEGMEDKRRAVALLRYPLTRELADPELSPRQRGALITE
jgi:hypothetical protein